MDRAQALQNDIRRQDELIEQAWAQLKQVEQVRWDLIKKLCELDTHRSQRNDSADHTKNDSRKICL